MVAISLLINVHEKNAITILEQNLMRNIFGENQISISFTIITAWDKLIFKV